MRTQVGEEKTEITTAIAPDVAVDGGVELQGDLRDRVRDALMKRGYVVKG